MASVVRRWVPVAAALAAVLVVATLGFYLGTRDDETDGSAARPTPSPTRSVAPSLTGILPFGICNQVTPIAEPTGL